MEILALLRPVILLSVLAVAAVTDVIKHRVGNRLLLAGVLLETAVHIASPVNADPDETGMRLIVISLLLAALWSAYLIVSRGILSERLAYFCRYLMLIGQGNLTDCIVCGKADNGEVNEVPILPMAVFIFIGACLTVVLKV